MVEDRVCKSNKKIKDARARYRVTVTSGQEAHFASHAKNMRNHGPEQRIKNQYPANPTIALRESANQQQCKSKTTQQTATTEKHFYTDENGIKDSRKCFQSRIPVLKGRTALPPLKNKNSQNTALDSTLSAADRRQKFHQTRLRAGCPESHQAPAQDTKRCRVLPALPLHGSHPAGPCPDPKINIQVLPKIHQTNNCHGVTTALRDAEDQNGQVVAKREMQDERVPESRTAINGKKKKGLLGEFTHFPALCNNTHKKPSKNTYISSVPHLPPILPPPAPPPPSVSASLEQEVK